MTKRVTVRFESEGRKILVDPAPALQYSKLLRKLGSGSGPSVAGRAPVGSAELSLKTSCT